MTERLRLRALTKELRLLSIPALLVTNLPDVRYLTGFTGSNAALVVLAGARTSARLFTDGRYTVQAKQQVQAATVRIAPKSALAEACAFAAESGASHCGFDPAHTTVLALGSMRSAVRKSGAPRGSFFVPCDGVVAKLRAVKDTAEIATMRRAAGLTCSLYEGMLGWIEAGMRELDVAAELEHRARLAGAESMSFETIVAAGERSSLPHARATDAILQPGDLITLDFGVVLDGYCSDMTRTFAIGYPGAVPPRHRSRWVQQREVFEAVLAAQQAAVRAVRAGVSCGAVDEAARSVLTAAGWKKEFSHSTGHGVGLEIHESPRVGKDQTEALRAGMVITIEPGVYLPGRFGVRIEDTVLVTDEGADVLTPAHKGWMEL
jgi:Xaa-Pro aminopeptidase